MSGIKPLLALVCPILTSTPLEVLHGIDVPYSKEFEVRFHFSPQIVFLAI